VPRYPYIAIEGAIGVGKTTLARILAEALPGEVLLEVFEENPFLSDFYADQARHAFQTQVFFLLSRYRQQHSVILESLGRCALISDYLFAKDWLFAHLNLVGDELAMYERVHAILGEQIPTPDLVVYLRASTDTLMRRIAVRDRSYERQMSRAYIDALRLAYDDFFAEYTQATVLSIETDALDYVRDDESRTLVINRVKSGLDEQAFQPLLPEMDSSTDDAQLQIDGRRLGDFQQFHHELDRRKGFVADIFFNYIRLTEEIGELGQALGKTWLRQDELLPVIGNQQEARQRALKSLNDSLSEELADILAYVLKLANDAGIDLERAYLKKMTHNWQREWRSE
jgi:deoxyguanosine kinase